MLLPVIDWKELWSKPGFRTTLIGVALVFVLGGIGVAGYRYWPEPAPKPPPTAPDTPIAQTMDYASSQDFNRLPMEKRVAWIESQMQRLGQMDDEEFAAAWRNMDKATRDRIQNNMREVVRVRMNRHIDEYFTKPKTEREAYLDQRIDEMKQWDSKFHKIYGRSGRGRTPQADPNAPPTPEQQWREQERKGMQQRFMADAYRFMGESADRRGKTAQFFNQIARRRAERGETDFFGRKPQPKQK